MSSIKNIRAFLISTICVVSCSGSFIAGTRFVVGWARPGISVNKVTRNRAASQIAVVNIADRKLNKHVKAVADSLSCIDICMKILCSSTGLCYRMYRFWNNKQFLTKNLRTKNLLKKFNLFDPFFLFFKINLVLCI